MSLFWVVDTKCKVTPESTLPQDGSAYYYGRSLVPAQSREEAIENLTRYLADDGILVEEVQSAVLYENGHWDAVDEFELPQSYADAKLNNEIEIGCFISENARNEV
ncbi:hypothetical protein O5O45_11615 [Hahella aquimaris]|uniref:hypothetical protein n=1 Tax=Hahella sp. HNIBRBA332 TaxID=3015983 RepID=UPI00273B548C|nr:hypothetical protein [Hahella sp. HNIBRBA332]WLQ16568.1 hypothetical protein O5O45_11615 [Hahella sp. HNIBRBA332]